MKFSLRQLCFAIVMLAVLCGAIKGIVDWRRSAALRAEVARLKMSTSRLPRGQGFGFLAFVEGKQFAITNCQAYANVDGEVFIDGGVLPDGKLLVFPSGREAKSLDEAFEVIVEEVRKGNGGLPIQ